MKITILTYGSRGDVQPFVPLAVGLILKGHSVKLAAPLRFRKFAEGHGIEFVPLAGEPEELSRQFNNVGFNPIKMVREFMRHAIEIGADVMRQTEKACEGTELIIHTFAHTVGAHTLARDLNIPDIHIQIFPMFVPTGDYPNVTLPDLNLRVVNRLTHLFAQRITWWTSVLGFEQVRRRAGLPKRKLYFPFDDDPLHPPTPVLCAWSPSVLPPPGDWGANVHVTGYFFLNTGPSFTPTIELQTFLDAGAPPVCISFGSMIHRDADNIDCVIRDALARTGLRGVVLSGWSKIEHRSSDNIFYCNTVPHDWLLPLCKMVIHHGGAGTTAAGLRAGIPNIVVPFTADQPFWGRRVHAMGAGPEPILVKNLSVEKLTRAILQVDDESLRKCAQAIGQRIRSEDGVGRAVEIIESHVSKIG